MCVCVCVYIYMYVSLLSSFHSLSYDKSIASSKASYPQSAIYCFNFQFQCPLISIKPSRSCLWHHPLPLALLSFPLSFLQQLVLEAYLTEDAFSEVIMPLFYCMFDIPLLLDYV